jgi:hypothetical protein
MVSQSFLGVSPNVPCHKLEHFSSIALEAACFC